jgi:hypothetical protein
MEVAVVNKTKGKLAASLDTSKSIPSQQLIHCLVGGSGDVCRLGPLVISITSARAPIVHLCGTLNCAKDPNEPEAVYPWARGNNTLVPPTILPLPVIS